MSAISLPHPSGKMEPAAMYNGLHLEMETLPERQREATLLSDAARNLRAKLLSGPTPSEWDASLADYLPVLEMWMDGLAEPSN